MRLPNGTILMHDEAPYDPQKAHEYYIRRRHLKGRKHGTTYTVTNSNGTTVKVSAKKLAEQKAYAAHRVEQIRGKLSKLTAELHKRLQKAAESERKSKEKPTAADKAKSAKESKDYREKHKQELKNKAKQDSSSSAEKKSQSKTETTADLKKEIVKTKSDLKAAVARQRELATAKKNG